MNSGTTGRESGSRFQIVRISAWALLALVIAAVLIHRHFTTPDIPLPRTVTIYVFSAMEAVMNEAILPAFQEQWAARTGQRVEFITTFAGSAAITHEILRKVPVDVAILASELDALRLTQRGVTLGPPRQPLPHAGVFSRSPMVLLARAGNPKEIRDFDDLGDDGIELVHADPVTSGGAEWAILSVYASAYRETADRKLAFRRVADMWDNVVTVAPSARAARREFQRGAGDAMITYESEAIEAARSGKAVAIYPGITLMSEHLVCKIVKHVSTDERELVDAFIDFLWSAGAQESLVRYGFRSVEQESNRGEAGLSATFMTLDDLGGVRVVKETVMDTLWREGILQGPSPEVTP